MKDKATVVATTTFAVVAPRELPTGAGDCFRLSSIYTSRLENRPQLRIIATFVRMYNAMTGERMSNR
jgi:hypothetical protein